MLTSISAYSILLGQLIGKSPAALLYDAISMKYFQDCAVAVKQSDQSSSSSTIINEISILRHIGYHPNVITLLGYTKLVDTVSIIMELADRNLLDYLRTIRAQIDERKIERVSSTRLMAMIRQVVYGMVCMQILHYL